MTVFICFARGDSEAVEALVRDIERTNREVWVDRELTGGERWWDEVLSQVRSCQLFVFVLSDKSLRSRACLSEYRYAVRLNRPVVPVLVRALTISPVPSGVADLQFVDYQTRTSLAVSTLLAALAAADTPVPLPSTLPPPPAVPMSYLIPPSSREVDARRAEPLPTLADPAAPPVSMPSIDVGAIRSAEAGRINSSKEVAHPETGRSSIATCE